MGVLSRIRAGYRWRASRKASAWRAVGPFAPVGAAFILGVAEQGERGGAHEPRQVFTGNLPPIGQGHPGHRNDRWEVPEFEYLCTQKLAKTHYPTAESYMLDRLTEDFGLPAFQHHDAGQDAAAAAHRVLPLAARWNSPTRTPCGRRSPSAPSPSRTTPPGGRPSDHQVGPRQDPGDQRSQRPHPVVRVLDEADDLQALLAKLCEEALELAAVVGEDDQLTKLADLQEVPDALAASSGSSAY